MIREVSVSDASRLCEIYNHYVSTSAITFEMDPVDQREMASRIAETTKDLPWLTITEEEEILGYAYATKWKGRCAYRHTVESTIYVDQNAAGRGLGTSLYGALISAIRERSMHTIIAGIALPNRASQSLHEKLGFQKVAHFAEVGFKLDRWIDVGYWQLVL